MRLSPQTSGNLFPDDTNTSHVVAPFWSNNDIRRDGEVNYEVHDGRSAESAAVVDQVSEAIVNQTGRDFRGTWMLVVEWRDCHPHPHGQSGLPLNSYLQQVIIALISELVSKPLNLLCHFCIVETGGDTVSLVVVYNKHSVCMSYMWIHMDIMMCHLHTHCTALCGACKQPGYEYH